LQAGATQLLSADACRQCITLDSRPSFNRPGRTSFFANIMPRVRFLPLRLAAPCHTLWDAHMHRTR